MSDRLLCAASIWRGRTGPRLNQTLPLFLSFSMVAVVAASLSGCFVTPPVRVKTSVKTASEQPHALPKSLPVAGKSNRQQVEEQYGAFAVDSGVPNLFLARFRKSSWAIAGGIYYMGGGTARLWSTKDLLVLFDRDGVARTVEVIPDKELGHRFMSMHRAAAFPPVDLAEPFHLRVLAPFSRDPTAVELTSTKLSITTQNAIVLKEGITLPAKSLSVPLDKIAAMTLDGGEDAGPDLYVLVRFSENTRIGKTVRFSTAPRDALKCIRWFEEAKAAQP